MELEDLENIWKRHNSKSDENISLNKELLKQMLMLKSKKRLRWTTIKAGFNLILPVVILLMFVPKFRYRAELDFYASMIFFGMFCLLTYYWAVRYFILLQKIDFNKTLTAVKKQIYDLENYKIRITKISFVLMPFAIISIFIISEIPIFSKLLLPFLLLMIAIVISIFYTFKHYMSENYRTLIDIKEIEKLEME